MRVLSATEDSGNAGFDALYTGARGTACACSSKAPSSSRPATRTSRSTSSSDRVRRSRRRSAGNGAFDATFAGTAGDGSHVLYETEEKVLAQDTDADVDVYDSAGTTALVSTGPAGGNGPRRRLLRGCLRRRRARVLHHGGEPGRRPTRTPSPTCTSAPAARPAWCRHGSAGGNGAFNASFAAASADGATAIFTTSERWPPATPTRSPTCTPPAPGADTRGRRARARCASRSSPPTSPARRRTAQHGPPLAFGSCAQPQQSSQDLTVGTPDANGQPAASVGYLRLVTLTGDPGTPATDEADVAVSLSITDVRESAGLADYTGEVTAALSVRLTDRDGPATTEDFPFDVAAPCAATADRRGQHVLGRDDLRRDHAGRDRGGVARDLAARRGRGRWTAAATRSPARASSFPETCPEPRIGSGPHSSGGLILPIPAGDGSRRRPRLPAGGRCHQADAAPLEQQPVEGDPALGAVERGGLGRPPAGRLRGGPDLHAGPDRDLHPGTLATRVAGGHRADPVPQLPRAGAARVRLRGGIHRAQLTALLGHAAQRHLADRAREGGPVRDDCSSPARRCSRSPPRPTSSAGSSRRPRHSSGCPTATSCCCSCRTRCSS